MKREEKITKIYELAIKGEELTTKNLNNAGINYGDITSFLHEHQGNSQELVRVERGHYKLTNIDGFYCYAKSFASKDKIKALKGFKICLEIDPNYSRAIFHLFLNCIKRLEFEQAFTLLQKLIEVNDNPFYEKDYNIYLYLLSFVIKLPEEYIEKVKSFKGNDFTVTEDDKRFNTSEENIFRLALLNQKFSKASTILRYDKKVLKPLDMAIDPILREITLRKNNLNNNLKSLIDQKNYQKVVDILTGISNMRRLNNFESMLLLVASDIINYLKTGEKIEAIPTASNNLFEMLRNKDYLNAKNAMEKDNYNNSILYTLICHMNELLEKTPVVSKEDDDTKVKEEVDAETKVEACHNMELYHDLAIALINNDLDNYPRLLREYLDNINKREYEEFVKLLIKKDILAKRPIPVSAMKCLAKIENGTFSIDINSFIHSFYDLVLTKKFDGAEIILCLLRECEKLGYPCLILEELELQLDEIKKVCKRKANKVDTPKQEDTSRIEVEKPKAEPKKGKVVVIGTPNVLVENNEDYDLKENNEDYDLKLIYDNLNRVKNHGIAILKPMNEKRRDHIHELVRSIDGISSFEIGDISEEKVVIRLQDKEGYISLGAIFKDSHNAFCECDYEKEKELLFQLFCLKRLKSNVFHFIGQCYLKLNRPFIAADYFEVADAVSRKENMVNPKCKVYDYSSLIAKLRGNPLETSEEEELKPYFNMRLEDFDNDLDDFYGVKQFNQFEHFLSIGLSIEEACNILKYDGNTALMALLLVARNHYAYGEDDKGDYYCKLVEKSKGKSREVVKMLEEVRKNKLFYKNRLVRTYD